MYHLKCLFNLRRKNIPQTCVTSYATIITTYFEITAFRENHNYNQVYTSSDQYDSIHLPLRDTIPKIQKLC